MDERLKFIARLLDGEKMAVLCRQFGISRKTGYKILTRYNEIGLEGLTDRTAIAPPSKLMNSCRLMSGMEPPRCASMPDDSTSRWDFDPANVGSGSCVDGAALARTF